MSIVDHPGELSKGIHASAAGEHFGRNCHAGDEVKLIS
jgi:hypothetical protein